MTSIIVGVLIVLLLASGLFDMVSWAFNIPAILLLAVIWVVGMYNGLIKFRNRVREAWSDIEVQLKRRYDLIPNLVSTVKGYAAHEQGTLDAVINARSKATAMHLDPSKLTAENLKAMQSAEAGLSQALGKLFALSESYPDLKANTNFLELQRELSDTENKIQAARRFYNGTVQEMNNQVEQFPSNMIAGMFGFAQQPFFDADEKETAPVEVKF